MDLDLARAQGMIGQFFSRHLLALARSAPLLSYTPLFNRFNSFSRGAGLEVHRDLSCIVGYFSYAFRRRSNHHGRSLTQRTILFPTKLSELAWIASQWTQSIKTCSNPLSESTGVRLAASHVSAEYGARG